MSDLNNDLCVISARGNGTTVPNHENFKPELVRGRLNAMHRFETVARASGVNLGTCRNEATNYFIEGQKDTLRWGPYMLSIVELPKETT